MKFRRRKAAVIFLARTRSIAGFGDAAVEVFYEIDDVADVDTAVAIGIGATLAANRRVTIAINKFG